MLKRADEMLSDLAGIRYYSSVAKIMNCWREFAVSVFQIWKLKYDDKAIASTQGTEEAVSHAFKMPIACNASRWGSVSACEELR
eukprot:8170341-Pyramimonas_sp.AAC.1